MASSTRRCLAAAAGVILAGSAALAEERAREPQGGSPQRNSGSGPSEMGARADEAGACVHEMSGTVKRLDRGSGTVSIDVAGMDDLTLRLPADELRQFEEGDQVVVSLGIRDARSGAHAPGGHR